MFIGQQILYVPRHANGDVTHYSVEAGFITGNTMTTESIFCRYWRNRDAGEDLRTKANSEMTPYDLIIFRETRDPDLVAEKCRQLGYEYGKELRWPGLTDTDTEA